MCIYLQMDNVVRCNMHLLGLVSVCFSYQPSGDCSYKCYNHLPQFDCWHLHIVGWMKRWLAIDHRYRQHYHQPLTMRKTMTFVFWDANVCEPANGHVMWKSDDAMYAQ